MTRVSYARRCRSHLVSSGKDGGGELRVGMASAAQVANNGLNIKRHPSVRDGQLITAVFKEKPARSAVGTRQARATGIEGTDTVDETIGGEMRMAANYHAASGEQWPESLIGGARFDSRAVVGLG
jgi:hypothetical protein